MVKTGQRDEIVTLRHLAQELIRNHGQGSPSDAVQAQALILNARALVLIAESLNILVEQQ